MRRIRTKLVLALLVVALIPVVPSYYLAKGVVDHFLAVGFSRTVSSVIEGARGLSRELFSRYEEETLEFAVALAGSDDVRSALRGGSIPDRVGADAARALGDFQIDMYDHQAQLIASLTKVEEVAAEDQEEEEWLETLRQEIEAELDAEVNVDSDNEALRDVLTRFAESDGEVDLSAHQGRLAELVQEDAPLIIAGNGTSYVTALAPVVGDGASLGFVVVSRVLGRDFARVSGQLDLVDEVHAMLGEDQETIGQIIRVGFWFLYATMAALAIAVGYALSRRFTSPLLGLVRGTQIVAAGNLDYRIEVSSRDEIGQLMESFNRMISQIRENQQLAREREQERQRIDEAHQQKLKDLEVSELKARTLQAENERQTIELQKTQELEKAYGELEQAHRGLQEAQAQLLLQEKMASMGALVAGLTHEINNPMGAIGSATDVSARCVSRIEEQVATSATTVELRQGRPFQQAVAILRENLQTARQASERVAALMRGLKNFARLDEAEFQMADLREGLESALILLRPQMPSGVEVLADYGEIPALYCNPAQLNQAFMNILRNAIQALGEEGEIGIQTSHTNGEILVTIRDNGDGIPPEQLERIFDFSFSATGSRVRMGSGLSMAYRIAQEHGGHIDIGSQVGEGTTVTIHLPMREGDV